MNEKTMTFDPAKIIGDAALEIWPNLPREIQEALFETAVKGQKDIRQSLAVHLHDHHPRTAHPAKPTALAE